MGEFPHLKKEIEEEYLSAVNAAANPYPHLFLEEFLLPILTGSMRVEEKDRRRAGQILDELLRSPDEDLASAALTAVLDMIAGSEKLRDASRSFLGPVALDWLDRLKR